MAEIRESSANTTIGYQAEPATVAQVVQDILAQIGKIKSVSRETGVIAGKLKIGWMLYVDTFLRISRKAEGAELAIQTTCGEGLLDLSSGAQKAISVFSEAVGQYQNVAGKSTGG
jgi:hypothetical protein